MPSGAERFPTFNPALATIDAIQQAETPTVVTSFPHTFTVGQYLNFVIPAEYGMTQLNGKTGLIVEIPSASSVRINIDTTSFDAFVVPGVPLQSAQAIPSGEVATTFYCAFRNVLPYP